MQVESVLVSIGKFDKCVHIGGSRSLVGQGSAYGDHLEFGTSRSSRVSDNRPDKIALWPTAPERLHTCRDRAILASAAYKRA
jgi:hypothetical protein